MADQSRNLEIAGFDLGHGQPALALALENSTCEPKMLEVQNERSFITAVAEHPTKGVPIGEEAGTTRDAANLKDPLQKPRPRQTRAAASHHEVCWQSLPVFGRRTQTPGR
jgi:hypothetical protein